MRAVPFSRIMAGELWPACSRSATILPKMRAGSREFSGSETPTGYDCIGGAAAAPVDISGSYDLPLRARSASNGETRLSGLRAAAPGGADAGDVAGCLPDAVALPAGA